MQIDPKNRLINAHPDLVRVIKRAAELTTVPFRVGETIRSRERQMQLVAGGKSTTMNSRHLAHKVDGKSRAVDLIAFPDLDKDGVIDDNELSWIWNYYVQIAKAVKQAAAELKIPVEWGGDWKTFKDGPHFQLPWKEYP